MLASRLEVQSPVEAAYMNYHFIQSVRAYKH